MYARTGLPVRGDMRGAVAVAAVVVASGAGVAVASVWVAVAGVVAVVAVSCACCVLMGRDIGQKRGVCQWVAITANFWRFCGVDRVDRGEWHFVLGCLADITSIIWRFVLCFILIYELTPVNRGVII